MKWSRPILMACVAAVVATGTVLFTGCESDESTDIAALGEYASGSRTLPTKTDISITPETVNLTAADVGQNIQFKVEGGKSGYKWSVATGAAGSILEQADDHYAIYTVAALLANTITVQSSDGKSATAQITISTGTFTLTPNTTVNATVGAAGPQFTASGGTAPYTWSVLYPADNNLVTLSGTQVRYDATANVGLTNTVYVTDSAGNGPLDVNVVHVP